MPWSKSLLSNSGLLLVKGGDAVLLSSIRRKETLLESTQSIGLKGTKRSTKSRQGCEDKDPNR